MHSDADSVIRAENRAQGLRIKRNNLLAAFLSGLTLVFISVKFVAPSWIGFLLGQVSIALRPRGFLSAAYGASHDFEISRGGPVRQLLEKSLGSGGAFLRKRRTVFCSRMDIQEWLGCGRILKFCAVLYGV
jgi:hypothetical protein